MNRTIKFRAWNKSSHEMSEVVALSSTYVTLSPIDNDDEGNNNYELEHTLCEDGSGIVQAIVLQFAGVSDKNGKEIYEGDIVKIEDYGVAKITFVDGSFMCEWIDDEAYSMELSQIIWKQRLYIKNLFEVVGNIYENPELLS